MYIRVKTSSIFASVRHNICDVSTSGQDSHDQQCNTIVLFSHCYYAEACAVALSGSIVTLEYLCRYSRITRRLLQMSRAATSTQYTTIRITQSGIRGFNLCVHFKDLLATWSASIFCLCYFYFGREDSMFFSLCIASDGIFWTARWSCG